MKPYFIISGTYEECFQYLNDKKWTYRDYDPIWVRSADSLRGHRNPDGVFVGTWYDRTDIDDIMLVLLASIDKDGSHKPEGLKTAIQFLQKKRGQNNN